MKDKELYNIDFVIASTQIESCLRKCKALIV